MNLKKIMNFDVLNQIKDHVISANHIAIFSHIHPDGDTIGAQLGLADVLRRQGKKVDIYNTCEKPMSFSFLTGFETLKIFDTETDVLPEVTICVDCANVERVGLDKSFFQDTTLIMIDHHEGNEMFGDINWVDPQSPATCEMVTNMLQFWSLPVNKEAATALYTGISTDTGSFKFEQINANTFETAGWLIQCGADHQAVRLKIYENQSRGKFLLTRELYSSATFMCDGLLVVGCITHEQLRKLNVREDEVHGLVGLLKEIEGVEASVLFRTLENGKTKISMRSKEWLDLNKVATKLGGGGHVRAAGVTMNCEYEEARRLTLEAINNALKEGLSI